MRSDWLTKAAAAESLGKLGDARAIEPLIPLLKDSKWPVRKAAAESLVSLFRTQGLSDKAKARVLQMKSTVTTTHLDQRVYERASSDCNILHTDSGIAVEPLLILLVGGTSGTPGGGAALCHVTSRDRWMSA